MSAAKGGETFRSHLCSDDPLQIVSDDGKKVRRRQPFTEKHKEELQVSTYVAPNKFHPSSVYTNQHLIIMKS
jgi:hypothetical protein